MEQCSEITTMVATTALFTTRKWTGRWSKSQVLNTGRRLGAFLPGSPIRGAWNFGAVFRPDASETPQMLSAAPALAAVQVLFSGVAGYQYSCALLRT